MNRDRLRALLREAPLPGAAEAERRGLALVEEAFAQRRRPPRTPLPRLAIAVALATLVAALLLSPAGAAVREWVGDVFETGVPDAKRGLSEIPGGGRLLVRSGEGPWVVQPDGSRRLLGRYAEAGWSPRGLFVVTASGRTLGAVEPDGTPRWSLPAPARVSDPRWSPSGFQIAYLAGKQLRVVGGDGEEDRLLDPSVKALPPAWSASGQPLLAYVSSAGALQVVNTDSDAALGSGRALAGIAALEWSPAGDALLESSPEALRLRPVAVRKALGGIELGRPRRVPLPAGAAIGSAAFSPDGRTIAVLLRRPPTGKQGPRSEVALIDPRGGPARRLFAVTGRLADLAWSPDGSRLLVSWPEADQWLFVPAGGRSRIRAIGGVAAEFAPGAHIAARFPRVEGWCCRR